MSDKKFETVFSLKKPALTIEDKFEKYIAELEEEIQRLKNINKDLSEKVRVEVTKAKGAKEQFMLHLSQFLTGLYTSLGKTQNDILKQSVHLNEYLAKCSQERSEAITERMTKDIALLGFNAQENNYED